MTKEEIFEKFIQVHNPILEHASGPDVWTYCGNSAGPDDVECSECAVRSECDANTQDTELSPEELERMKTKYPELFV